MTPAPGRRLLAIGAAVALLLAPSPAPDTYPNDGTRIMFVGDSITGSPGCWRPAVWAALTDAGHDVNMVGLRTENECGDVTNAAGAPWDPDNLGIGGITTTRMWVKLTKDRILESTDPDVIVMLLGTNDLLGGATADAVLGEYSKLMDVYRDHDPNITVVMGAPPPLSDEACGCDDAQQALAAALPAWALSTSTPSSLVTVADLSTGFDPATDTSDGIHPNDAGNAKLAAAWSPVIATALDARAIAPAPSPSTTATATPSDSPAASPSPSPTGALEDEQPPPSAKSWVVLVLVVLVAGGVTLAMGRSKPRQP